METHLWKASEEKLNKSNLALYCDFIKQNYKINLNNNFNKLWQWSVENPKIFWKSIWDFTHVKGKLGNILFQESDIFFKKIFSVIKRSVWKKFIIYKYIRFFE